MKADLKKQDKNKGENVQKLQPINTAENEKGTVSKEARHYLGENCYYLYNWRHFALFF